MMFEVFLYSVTSKFRVFRRFWQMPKDLRDRSRAPLALRGEPSIAVVIILKKIHRALVKARAVKKFICCDQSRSWFWRVEW